MKHRFIIAVALFMAALIGSGTFATDLAAGPKTPEERREERRKRREERREERRKRQAERREERKERRQEARKRWRERRRAARREFIRKWGRIYKRPAVRAELRTHAYRVARLRRLRVLAQEADRQDQVQRADKLLAQEQARHHARLKALRGARK